MLGRKVHTIGNVQIRNVIARKITIEQENSNSILTQKYLGKGNTLDLTFYRRKLHSNSKLFLLYA
jgi:hypothetical protein